MMEAMRVRTAGRKIGMAHELMDQAERLLTAAASELGTAVDFKLCPCDAERLTPHRGALENLRHLLDLTLAAVPETRELTAFAPTRQENQFAGGCNLRPVMEVA